MRPERPGWRPERPGLRPERQDLRPERQDLRLERPGWRPERLDFRPERQDLRPERLDLRLERPDLKPERPDSRLEGPDEGGDGRTNERMNESPPVFHRTSSPSGPLPKKRRCDGPIDGRMDRHSTRLDLLHKTRGITGKAECDRQKD